VTPAVAGDTALQSDVLEDLSSAVNYRRWIVDLTRPYLDGRVLEIGSGNGDYAEEWADRGVAITASEADASRLAVLKDRFDGDGRVDVRELLAPITGTNDYDAVVALNVMEHIDDDVEAMRSFARQVRPGGLVVLFVPAFPIGMSRFDREIGHFRRYRKKTLRGALVGAGLDVEVLRHVNALGLFAWIVMMRLLRQRPKAGPLLRLWDGLMIRIIRLIESRVEPPLGQSLLAVARTRSG
jgi:SAM-dependent methyltransferase